MTYEDLIFQYEGFNPKENEHAFLKNVFFHLLEKCPSGSDLHLNISKENEVYKAILKVQSISGPIYCVATAEDLHHIAIKIQNKLMNILHDWHENRFRGEHDSKMEIKRELRSLAI